MSLYGGYAGQGAALAGIYGITARPDRNPTALGRFYTDFVAPRYGVVAIAAAIRHCNLTGRGPAHRPRPCGISRHPFHRTRGLPRLAL
ncbi:MAG: CoA transferase [Dehalococcoidia bacterium]|uniref:hypothetical protein n=1 Tax=Candidatus Amarobacter glycogenicus TaxID=3140699 RepID=UPI003134BEEE|nr:CoA transferase [Dehalococcoidia bacterium]